ncbi:MAG: GTPase [Sulfolobaceae archaeon]|jgi:Predicted GTPases|nr:50S ribosome-binding GTPase [Sulfolobales archaeon]
MLGDVFRAIARADLVVEVLDSREPDLTRSRYVEGKVVKMGKKLLIAINKGDLVPLDVLKGWKNYFESFEGIPAVYLAANQHAGTKVLRDRMKEILMGSGIVCFVGYPKTGKSSIINALKGRHSASTSSYPFSYGYTRGVQLFRIDNKLMALDTPGVIPPDGSELEKAIRGANVDELENPVKVAIELIKRVETFNPSAFKEAYGLNYSNPFELLEKLALKRGWVYKSDKEPNVDEAAKALIRNYHDGKIRYYVPPPKV